MITIRINKKSEIEDSSSLGIKQTKDFLLRPKIFSTKFFSSDLHNPEVIKNLDLKALFTARYVLALK